MTKLSSHQITLAFLIENGRKAVEKYRNSLPQQLKSLSSISCYQKQTVIEELIEIGNKLAETHQKK